ncbi:MAG: thioredoxin family protein [Kofleriaceae bacterium]
MSRLLVSLGLVGLLASCKKEPAKSPPADDPGKPAAAKPAPADDPCAKARPAGHEGSPIAWIHDDYPAALACAKARDLPLVLDLWAPWCHTCLSMQSTVFTDPSFAAAAPKFVFAALDTDREQNAAAVAKYPLSAWPTFYVVGPDEAVLARFVGAASVSQFQAFLDAGARAKSGGAAGADAHLLAAERALATQDVAAAERELEAALAAAPAEWPRRPDALVSLIGAKHKRGDLDGCLGVAERSLAQTGNAASASDFLYHAAACAAELAKDAKLPADQRARIGKLREAAVARWRALVDDPSAPLSVDDRSDAMANLREALIALDQPDAAKAVAERQRALLDETADKAATPMAAMTYNWPRAEVYVYLGRPLDLVPALERSAKALPREYDPPARLGWIYLKGGKLAEAATWTDAAIRLAYGPRKARVLAQRAEIAHQQGDQATERRMRQDVVALYESLPAGQVTPETIGKAKQALADLDAKATAAP